MLLENVKGLLSHDRGHTFEVMCSVLNDIGYAIDFRVLNSKHFGVPQNRERIYIVCDRDAEHEAWNVKGNDVVAKAKRRIQALGVRTFNFDWPAEGGVTARLRDVMEPVVDEKYYLSEDKTVKLIAQLEARDNAGNTDDCEMVGHVDGIKGHDICRRVYSSTGIAPTIPTGTSGNTTPKIAEPQIEKIGHLPSDNGQTGAVYGTNGIAPTCLNQHGNTVTKIVEPCVNDRGTLRTNSESIVNALDANYAKGLDNHGQRTHVMEPYTVIQKTHSASTTIKHDETGTLQAARLDKVPQVVEEIRPVLTPDREEKRQNGRRFKDDGEESFTLTAQDKHGVAIGHYPRYRIRKLTPRECWRLQGFADEQHDAVAASGVSDSQRYKQAGNAVTVNVIAAISKPLIARLEVITVG
ncbi:hypothetical protein PACILC2_22550 [Paenibacillus cisolokensis]|uniref:DNA (cytosine-5-)-methyltransferase n=1 Tax=Paenibacillus cisolokensis TaxID=1658519 RepID=A0ABQ4N6B0_9BACL|nr:DNA (cytosine-5-)-methyltransferase [Paenibacillus cisolokensis]GIQ63687.1 hypothetical protein PACILC2_22550 [Paenibacillus cisolokensis]